MLCFHAERKTSSRALPLCTGSARTPPRRPSQPLGATATQLGISSCAEQPFSGSLAVLEPVMKMDCGCSVNSGTRSSRAIGWPAGAIRMGHLRASGGECAAASRRLIAPSARTAHATRPRCRSVVSECSKSSTRDGLRTRSAVLIRARPPREARRTIKLLVGGGRTFYTPGERSAISPPTVTTATSASSRTSSWARLVPQPRLV